MCYRENSIRSASDKVQTLPTGEGDVPRWLTGEVRSMCVGEKSLEQKSLQTFTASSLSMLNGRRRLCFGAPHANANTMTKPHMSNHSTLAIRLNQNPLHHLWNNNGTWWCHYTIHLSDYTKRRVRRNLHTSDSQRARTLRDTILRDDGRFEPPVSSDVTTGRSSVSRRKKAASIL